MKELQIIMIIELGLNVIAQNVIWKSHTKKDIENYIKRFEYEN